jgi:hypothetical protein
VVERVQFRVRNVELRGKPPRERRLAVPADADDGDAAGYD